MPDAPAATALVVAAHGRRGFVEIDGERRPFVPKGRNLRIVCGDRVRYEAQATSEDLLAFAIEHRSNTLARCHQHGLGEEVIAANLTQLIAVCAPRPEPDLFLIDRYLCAAELMGCRPVLAWNKCDLGARMPDALRDYQQIGYRLIELSARTGTGMEALLKLLAGQVSALVGQSGTGKSSLINALAPGATAIVGELSAAMSTGTHTTTAVLMYTVAAAGRLLDTPGVRDFIPAIDSQQRIAHGFPEFRSLDMHCKFADCEHDHEPGCAIKQALAAGNISRRRYESYLRLRSAVTIAGRRPGA